MNKLILTLFLTYFFTSCSGILQEKHLNEKTFTYKDITVKWYGISEITTVHDFVELTRWGRTKKIMETNDYGIHNVIITGDKIIIRTIPKLTIYELVARTLNCNIKVDTTVTIDEYRNKLRSEEGK